MTDVIEQANAHLQSKSRPNPANNPTRASSFAALNGGGSFANPKRAKDSEKSKQLEEFSRGKIGPGEALGRNSRLRSQENIFFDPDATLTDKHGNEAKVRSLEFGAYSADRCGANQE